jgi:Flp pilus assembly secretin CpaC
MRQILRSNSTPRRWTAVLLLGVFPGAIQGQAVSPAPVAPANATQSAQPGKAPATLEAKPVRSSDKRHAEKLYFASSKLYEKALFEEAMHGYERAAALDPENADYALAIGVARSHAVTALIQAAARDRNLGDAAGARAALAHALELDSSNPQAREHLFELGEDALRGQAEPIYEQGANSVGEAPRLEPTAGVQSFHLRTGQRQIIQQVFKAFGIETTIDNSVRDLPARLDVDGVDFEAAARLTGMVTNSFAVTLDAHHVLVALDSHDNRLQFTRLEMETVYLSGLTTKDLTEVVNLAKNVFSVQQAASDPTSGTITLRAPEETLVAFNATMSQLLAGRDQVLLEVRLIQLAHTSGRNTGVQPPQSISAFNIYSEEQSLLNANQALVQQIVSSGLAAPGDTLAILGILLASGQISSSLFSNGVALFGGGITQSALAPGGATFNFNLNTSDSRELDEIQLRLGDGEVGTIKSGTKYPIQTSSFSSLGAGGPSIPGLTGAGASGALSSLLSSLSSVPNIPQVTYQDLGLTLKATPKLMRSNEVALTIDLAIDALAGSSINGNPILNNRAYSGVVTLKEGDAVVVTSEMDRSESRAISGTPGISEIPGLNNLTANTTQKSQSTLLIIMTAHVIRGTQPAGHSARMRVEGATGTSTGLGRNFGR